jgi:hypothetical protein
VAQVLPCFGVEVADAEGFGGYPGEGSGVVQEATQDAGAALGRFVEEDEAPVVALGQGLGGELVVF